MEHNQGGIFENFTGYFRGRARQNPKETLCIHVLTVGNGGGAMEWIGGSKWLSNR